MGLYSANRVVRLASAYNESAAPSIDFEHTEIDESAPSLLEASLMLHEADQTMFDTLIGLDFVEAQNEKAMLESGNEIALNESGQKADSIIYKLTDFIKKAIESIKAAIRKFIAKVRNFVNDKTNKTIVDSAKKKVGANTLNNADKKAHVNYPKIDDKAGGKNYVTAATNRLKKLTVDAQMIADSGEITTFDDEIASFEEELAGLQRHGDTKKGDTTTGFDITYQDVVAAEKFLSEAQGAISAVSTAGEEAIKGLQGLTKTASTATRNNKDDAHAAAVYKLYSKLTNLSVKFTNAMINNTVYVFKYQRAILLAAIHTTSGKSKDEINAGKTVAALPQNHDNDKKFPATTESAYLDYIKDVSDVFVENYFSAY